MQNQIEKQNAKQNFHKDFLKVLEKIKNTFTKKPSLLLHACCAPCSSYCIELMAQVFDITIYYYNPNIHPQSEYERRLQELKKFLTVFPPALQEKVKLICGEYNTEDFFKATNVKNEIELQHEAEKGERCRRCYKLRMSKAWDYACQHEFDFFTTTLSISPHKDSLMINQIGLALPLSTKTKYLPADFKKNAGYLRSTQLSKEFGLWRQDYCGCVFSKQNKPAKEESLQ